MTRDERDAKARAIAEQLLGGRSSPGREGPKRDRPPIHRSELERVRERVNAMAPAIDAARSAANTRAQASPDVAEQRPDPSEPLTALVLEFHRALLAHPRAARGLFASLVAEGRDYAERSEEGAQLHAELLRAPRVADASRLLRALAQGMLDDEAPGELPSSYVDNLMRIVDAGQVEAAGAELFAGLWGPKQGDEG